MEVEDEVGGPTGDPKSGPIFHPYCSWHIQSGTVLSMERGRESEKQAAQMEWEECICTTTFCGPEQGPNFLC